ncbi:MAG: hypothetical protein ACRDSH_02690 [Pseudonocardiaceae bacterium]
MIVSGRCRGMTGLARIRAIWMTRLGRSAGMTGPTGSQRRRSPSSLACTPLLERGHQGSRLVFVICPA